MTRSDRVVYFESSEALPQEIAIPRPSVDFMPGGVSYSVDADFVVGAERANAEFRYRHQVAQLDYLSGSRFALESLVAEIVAAHEASGSATSVICSTARAGPCATGWWRLGRPTLAGVRFRRSAFPA